MKKFIFVVAVVVFTSCHYFKKEAVVEPTVEPTVEATDSTVEIQNENVTVKTQEVKKDEIKTEKPAK